MKTFPESINVHDKEEASYLVKKFEFTFSINPDEI